MQGRSQWGHLFHGTKFFSYIRAADGGKALAQFVFMNGARAIQDLTIMGADGVLHTLESVLGVIAGESGGQEMLNAENYKDILAGLWADFDSQ